MSGPVPNVSIAYLAQGKIRVKTGSEGARTIDSAYGNSIREKAARAQQEQSWKGGGDDGSRLGTMRGGKSAMNRDIALVSTSSCGGKGPGALLYSLQSGSLCGLLEVAQHGAEEPRRWDDNRTQIR